ncbi:MAG: metal-dependent hydrolase [Sideroxydans sp.]|nr:metal-dependent hydrolase [Sideroxydans sp.]
MRWFNHILISGAPAALIAPSLVPVVVLGATAPDWLEWVSGALHKQLPHRGATHWVAAWIVALAGGALLPGVAGSVVSAFAWGGLSHCLADSLTVTGVPFSPLSDRRFHLLGGRLRTGGAGEYGVSWSVVLVCWMLAGQFTGSDGRYIPFFFNWSQRYQDGIATAKEWRDNRMKFF